CRTAVPGETDLAIFIHADRDLVLGARKGQPDTFLTAEQRPLAQDAEDPLQLPVGQRLCRTAGEFRKPGALGQQREGASALAPDHLEQSERVLLGYTQRLREPLPRRLFRKKSREVGAGDLVREGLLPKRHGERDRVL